MSITESTAADCHLPAGLEPVPYVMPHALNELLIRGELLKAQADAINAYFELLGDFIPDYLSYPHRVSNALRAMQSTERSLRLAQRAMAEICDD